MDHRLRGRQPLKQAAQVRRQTLPVGKGQLVHVAQRHGLLFAKIRAEDDELAAIDSQALAQLEVLLGVLAELVALAHDDKGMTGGMSSPFGRLPGMAFA